MRPHDRQQMIPDIRVEARVNGGGDRVSSTPSLVGTPVLLPSTIMPMMLLKKEKEKLTLDLPYVITGLMKNKIL